jgi:hypothetical protein
MAHSASDWTYTVSEAVASYTLTGMIGFVVVKQLKLQDRVTEVPWRRVNLVAIAILVLFGLGVLLGSLLLGDNTAH